MLKNCLLLFTVVTLTSNSLGLAENQELPSGADRITVNSVKATVSYLASDELAGRGTASPEFDIAAAYVRSRFIASGLTPAGDDESFYHETIYPVRTLPALESVSLADSTNPNSQISPAGLLGTPNSLTIYNGELIEIDATKTEELKNLTRVAVTQWETTAKGQRALSQLARVANHLQAAGAKGLILRAAPNSEWIRLAKELEGTPRTDRSRDIELPIIVIPIETKLPNSISLKIPPASVKQHKMRNVIGAIPGSDPILSKQAVIYSAHLDHLGKTSLEGDNIYNGADDDASGVTAVLTLADAFSTSKNPPKRTLLFMTFWGEESGLLGSQAFVERPTWPLQQITANINIEMIGRPEPGAYNRTWVTGWNESDLGPITRNAAKPFGFEIFEHPQFSSMLYRASDNWSFAQKGVIAHSFAAGSLHNDYHQVDDEWEKLEIDHMTKVIQGLYVGTLPLADGSVTPSKIEN